MFLSLDALVKNLEVTCVFNIKWSITSNSSYCQFRPPIIQLEWPYLGYSLGYAMLCYAIIYNRTIYYTTWYAIIWYTMLSYVVLCYTILCYAVLCCAIWYCNAMLSRMHAIHINLQMVILNIFLFHLNCFLFFKFICM